MNYLRSITAQQCATPKCGSRGGSLEPPLPIERPITGADLLLGGGASGTVIGHPVDMFIQQSLHGLKPRPIPEDIAI